MTLEALFTPHSVALVGAAHSAEKLGGVVLANLLRYKGRVYPVTPHYSEVMGLPAFPSVRELPETVDLVLVVRPAAEVPGIVRELSGKARFVIVMSAGFAESGESALQADLRNAAAEAGVRLLGPNCMGLYNPRHRLDTLFLTRERLARPKSGAIAIVSQSGAILSCMLGAVHESRAGISTAIGYGNALDIDETDIFAYLGGDDQTRIVVAYIESLGDGRRFLDAALRLTEKKPLIILKSGKGTGGQAAAFSHTGRLAGSYEVFHSILRRAGLREAATFDDLMDGAKALSFQKSARGSRVLIITNGGGSGVLAVDECMRQGLEVTMLSEDHKTRLRQHFPSFFGMNNPVDLTAQVQDDDYVAVIRELGDDFDGFVIIALPNVLGITKELARKLADCAQGVGKPFICHIPPGGIGGSITLALERSGLPVYQTPERAVRALRALLT